MFVQQVHDDAEVQEDEDDNEVSVAPTSPSPTPELPHHHLHKNLSLHHPKLNMLNHHHHHHYNNLHKLIIRQDCSSFRDYQAQAKGQEVREEVQNQAFKIKEDTDEVERAEVEEMLEVVTASKLMTEVVTTIAPITTATQVPKASALRKRRGVVIQDPETTAASVILYTEERNNMMIYLKNMAGFKMNFFKEKVKEEVTEQEEGSKRKGDSLKQKAAKKQRIDEEVEELKRHLQIVPNDDDVYTEAIPLASKVPVIYYQIHHENNKPYYKIIRADGTHKLFLCFVTLLKNFNREDLEEL
nr:hypothetical protein [Tanacetum cinerariifolium]